tara:strand:+ start:189 stop:533 length:345 start_codon:yes stop_codon:yes gene_type:complete
MTETIDVDVRITINLTDLVNIRCDVLDLDYDDLDTCDRLNVINDLRTSLTWDTLYSMVDNALLEYIGDSQNHYGEIQPEPGREAYLNQIEKNKKQFEMVDLVSPSWTIQVPRRK